MFHSPLLQVWSHQSCLVYKILNWDNKCVNYLIYIQEEDASRSCKFLYKSKHCTRMCDTRVLGVLNRFKGMSCTWTWCYCKSISADNLNSSQRLHATAPI